MGATTWNSIFGLLLMWTAATTVLPAGVYEQPRGAAIGSVRLPQPVMADGKVLAAGTYEIRVTHDRIEPARGQSPDGERWIAFVVNGAVAGREVATVVSSEEIEKIAKCAPPNAGTSRVDLLKGGDYVRVWVNDGGTHYIINMPPSR